MNDDLDAETLRDWVGYLNICAAYPKTVLIAADVIRARQAKLTAGEVPRAKSGPGAEMIARLDAEIETAKAEAAALRAELQQRAAEMGTLPTIKTEGTA